MRASITQLSFTAALLNYRKHTFCDILFAQWVASVAVESSYTRCVQQLHHMLLTSPVQRWPILFVICPPPFVSQTTREHSQPSLHPRWLAAPLHTQQHLNASHAGRQHFLFEKRSQYMPLCECYCHSKCQVQSALLCRLQDMFDMEHDLYMFDLPQPAPPQPPPPIQSTDD